MTDTGVIEDRWLALGTGVVFQLCRAKSVAASACALGNHSHNLRCGCGCLPSWVHLRQRLSAGLACAASEVDLVGHLVNWHCRRAREMSSLQTRSSSGRLSPPLN